MFLTVGWLSMVYAAYICTSDSIVCLNTTVIENSMRFEVTCKCSGWCAFGLNSDKMAGSEIYLMYFENNNSSITVRQGVGHRLPVMLNSQPFDIIQTTKQNESFSYHFQRNITINGLQGLSNSLTPIIFAYTNTPVNLGRIGIHSLKESTKVNLFDNTFIIANTETVPSFVITHGVLMILSWLVCSFIGIFSARFCKQLLGLWWFRIHSGFLSLSVLSCIISFALILIEMADGENFTNIHHLLGVFVFILILFQFFLGLYIDVIL